MPTYYTKEGLEKLQEELNRLITIERPSISAQIAEARDKGDLSENAEYDAAKNAQGLLELRISKLQEIIADARVVDDSMIDTSKVSLFTKVLLRDLKKNCDITYMIVSENEANIKEGKISINTPIAKGLIGKKVGEEVEIKVPVGLLKFRIMNITK